MSRTGDVSWKLTVPRAETGPTPVRITVRGHEAHITISGSRPLVLDVRLLAELVEDLRAAGRGIRSAQAMDYIRAAGREAGFGPVDRWAPILSDAELDALDDEA